MHRTYTQEQKDEALRLVQDVGRVKAGKQLGIPVGTVSRWTTEAGVKAATTCQAQNVRAATEVRLADLADKRAELARGLMEDAARLRACLWSPSEVYNFGGKDNTFSTATVSNPSYRDKQAIFTSIGIALDKAVMLERHDADGNQGQAAVDEWLKTVLGR